MPFHAIFSIFLGKIFKTNLVQAWKEILITLMFISYFIFVIRKKSLGFKLDIINITALSIVSLSLLISVFNFPGFSAFVFGLKTNILPILLFLLAQIGLSYFNFQKLNYFVIVPAIIVAILAIMQSYVLPLSFWSFLGYSSQTIEPAQLVDPALKAIRAFSSLGGPNQLGAYLIVPAILSFIIAVFNKKYIFFIPFLLSLFGIFVSYSRSAWIGIISGLILSIFLLTKLRGKIILLLLSIFTILVSFALIWQSPLKEKAQYYLFHGRIFENRIEGSDQERLKALDIATSQINANPLGYGLGSAGPASFYSDKTLISENWLLQIAIEIGIIGLFITLVFLILNTLELNKLFLATKEPLYLALQVSIVALFIVNLFLHAFADSTLSIIFFSLLGITREIKK